MGEYEQANRALEALLEIDPDDDDALSDRRHPLQMNLHEDRGGLLMALGAMVYTLPDPRRFGPLNRVLHLLVMNLNGVIDAGTIYRLIPPLWRKLTPAEQYACDEYRDECYPTLFTVYLFAAAGRWQEAKEALANAKQKKRVLRLLARCAGVNT